MPCFLKLIVKVADIPPGTCNVTGKDKEMVQKVSSAQPELAVMNPVKSLWPQFLHLCNGDDTITPKPKII